jgi:hypothetical protein
MNDRLWWIERDSYTQVVAPELQPQRYNSALSLMGRGMQLVIGDLKNIKYPGTPSSYPQELHPHARPQPLYCKCSHNLAVTCLSSGSDLSFSQVSDSKKDFVFR